MNLPIEFNALLLYIAATAAVLIVPGPTVTVIIANSLRYGSRAGWLNIAGTQLGLSLMILVLASGLDTIVGAMGGLFEWLRLAGAAYLVWLGFKMFLARGQMLATADQDQPIENGAELNTPARPSRQASWRFFWQGFLVIWSNPKALFFFGAFIPQFIDPSGSASIQVIWLGVVFMIMATALDGCYAALAGRSGRWLKKGSLVWLERASGSCLVGGGIWLALSRN